MIGAIMGLFGGSRAWMVYAAVAVAVLGIIGYQRIVMANRAAEIARLESVVTLAKAAVAECKGINERNVTAVQEIQAQNGAAVAAITRDRDRLVAEFKALKIVREKIHAEATQCVGVPNAIRSVADWLRDNPADHP